MTKREGKIEIEIDRAWEGCRWMWDVWVDDKFCDNGVEDTAKAAMDAALKAIKLMDDAVERGLREHGTLTAEQVRKAIFDGSVYASYDGAQYYANGISMQAIADELNATLGSEINGDTSDGYHTFNELYYHRAVLFSVIVRDHRELAWKARKHHDGTMYDGMFIVGIETPEGQATYHYDLDPYWEMFDCDEREFAPEWDGHTPDDAIARIAELGSSTCNPDETETLENVTAHVMECDRCGGTYEHVNGDYEWCPRCGKRCVHHG